MREEERTTREEREMNEKMSRTGAISFI